MQEIWKDIIIDNKNTGWKVSNLGRCMRRDGSITTGSYNRDNYKQVRINYKSIRIHRLVAEYFIPNPENKKCIDHIDTNKENNSVENLRWCTYKENMNNPITIQNCLKRPKHYGFKNALGKKNCLGKTNSAKRIKCIETGEIYSSCAEASRKLNISASSISNSINPKQANKSAGGYHWEYLS